MTGWWVLTETGSRYSGPYDTLRDAHLAKKALEGIAFQRFAVSELEEGP